MQKTELNQISIYRFDIFNKFDKIKHFISTRNPSAKMEFNICLWAVEEILSVIENRKILASELGINLSHFVFQQQKHTHNVTTIKNTDVGKGAVDYNTAIEGNDAMITNERGICLVVIAGDCVPILLYDPVKEVIGAVHSGWRGTSQHVAAHTISNMIEKFGCKPSDILAAIGPSISPEVYEIDDVVFNAFSKSYKSTSAFFKPLPSKGKYLLDLWTANKIQMLEVGIKEQNIEVAGICTYKNNNEFFSARRGDSGRFGCGIMLL
jgi:YfiH family protein